MKSADIKGYRDLAQNEIDLANRVKEMEMQVGRLWEEVVNTEGVDPRWAHIARTDIQTGFMALVRSIFKPESF